MSDNMNDSNTNNYQPTENRGNWTDGNCNTLRFLANCLSAFLGGFLAIFALGGILTHGHKNLHKVQNIPYTNYQQEANFTSSFFNEKDFRNIEREINKDFELLSPRPAMPFPFTPKMDKIVSFEENPNNYKIYINLKKFNNDEKNININIKNHSIKIDGKISSKDENSQSSFSYMQDIPLRQKIETDAVKKEKIGNTYVITLPFDD